MKQALDTARRRAGLDRILLAGALLSLVACVSFTRDGRPIYYGNSGPSGNPGEPGASPAQGDDEGTGYPYGRLWITYYWLVEQRDYPGDLDTVLFDKACRPLATTSAAFSDELCIEGSGRLDDGRVVNYAATCACGRPCPNGGRVCYEEVEPEHFPWGKGSRSNPLVPLRSIATDPGLLPFGTQVYIKEFDGAVIPSHDGLGGFVHDGCFRADDVGTAIEGAHIDIFAGSESVWQALEAVAKTHGDVTISLEAARCTRTFQGR